MLYRINGKVFFLKKILAFWDEERFNQISI